MTSARHTLIIRPHVPSRPLWLCKGCAARWPCPTAKVSLNREYANDGTALRVYLNVMLFTAITDLRKLNPHPGPQPEEMWARFLSWVGSVPV